MHATSLNCTYFLILALCRPHIHPGFRGQYDLPVPNLDSEIQHILFKSVVVFVVDLKKVIILPTFFLNRHVSLKVKTT